MASSLPSMPAPISARAPSEICVSWWDESEGARCWFSAYFHAPVDRGAGDGVQAEAEWTRALAEGIPAFFVQGAHPGDCPAGWTLGGHLGHAGPGESQDSLCLSHWELGEAPSSALQALCELWAKSELIPRSGAAAWVFFTGPDGFYDPAIQGDLQRRLAVLAQRDALERCSRDAASGKERLPPTRRAL